MRFERSALRSRVARRIFVLFIVSALVPVVVTALLSLRQLREVVTEETAQRLREGCKSYGQSIYQRLVLLEDSLTVVANEVSSGAPVSSQQFDDRFIAISTNRSDELRSYEDAEHLMKGRMIVLTRSSAGREALQIFGQRAIDPANPDAGIVEGQIRPDFLLFHEGTEFSTLCLFDDNGHKLHCPREPPRSVNAELDSAWPQSTPSYVAFDLGGREHVATNWTLFLKPRFRAGSWQMYASHPQDSRLGVTSVFGHILPASILLSVLTVVLLSVSQIRRVLVPIERLIDGNRRLAERDFSSPVEVSSGDEFEELATSLNTMSRHLERQFAGLGALADIDRMIIAKETMKTIVETMLTHLVARFEADLATAVVLEGSRQRGWSLTLGSGLSRHNSRFSQVVLPAEERAHLLRGDEQPVSLRENSMTSLHVLKDNGCTEAMIGPVVFDNELYGVIALGWERQATTHSNASSVIKDFAGRVAVACKTKSQEKELVHRANFDPLTKLPNRLLFHEFLERELAHARRSKSLAAVLFLDIDRFKQANDAVGHSFGDELLRLVASRLMESVRQTDVVARLGGDEFTVLLTGAGTPAKVEDLARKILRRLEEPHVVDGREYFLSASIGVALHPLDGQTPDELLRNADTAMYRGKKRGGGTVVRFQQEMNVETTTRTTLEQDLYRALEREELFLVFQPRVDVVEGRVISAEALLRWKHPVRGFVPPNHFIDLAEETGLIHQIGMWVVREALSQWRSWRALGLNVDEISVNVSPRQFQANDFARQLGLALREYAVEAKHLELEVTENLLAKQAQQSTNFLSQVRELGVKLAIDDFGTGFSSLSYLQDFEFDTLKVDRSFVQRVLASPQTAAIVRSIIELAHALDKKVVAEGVEEVDELLFLEGLGCDEIQGYYYCRPVPSEEFVTFVRGHTAEREQTSTGPLAHSIAGS